MFCVWWRLNDQMGVGVGRSNDGDSRGHVHVFGKTVE